MNKRIQILISVLVIAWITLVGRLFYIQLWCSSEFSDLANDQHFREVNLESHRGDILDRNGKKLAMDLAYYSFEAYPRYIQNPGKVTKAFASEFNKTRGHYAKLLKKNRNFVYLERKVPAFQADRIANIDLQGVQKFTHFKRFYPNGNITGQILGFTNIDNLGIEGLELRLNSFLAGKPGKMIVTADALGRKKTNYNYPIQRPVDGFHVETTIDVDCQAIAVEELSKAVEKYRAVGGKVILMEPFTGEILAMASLPDFDSNFYWQSEADTRRNRTVTDLFEPGSIYKVVTASAALELGLVKPEDIFFCENGETYIGRHRFRDSKPHGNLSFQKVIELSSNIGTYKVAQIIGEENLYKYSLKFGFTSKTGIDFPGETPGMLKKPSRWSKTSLSCISIGQEIAVNAMQIVNAYAAVANGGLLMQPYMVKAVKDGNGNTVEKFDPKAIRRVISQKTAETLTKFFIGVVDSGTAVLGKINGRKLAGKTGTAQKIDPVTKGYSQTDYVSSFVAYYPADKPKIVGIVILDTPRGGHYGGLVAGPVLRDILKRISYLPKNTLLASSVKFDENEKKGENFWTRINQALSFFSNTAIAHESPENKTKEETGKKNNEPVLLNIKNNSTIEKKTDIQNVLVPDVRGLPIRDAIKKLASAGLDFEVAGSGVVKTQSPDPGKKVKKGSVTRLSAENDKEESED